MKKRVDRTIASFGHRISTVVAEAASHPFAQLSVIGFCIAWWAIGLPTDELTAALSILAITLTQMVLSRQLQREKIEHRRDIAMHAKLDELLRAEALARKELAGIEELEEEQIAALKEKLAKARAR